MSYHSRTNLASKLFLGTCISAAALSCNSENLFGIHSRTDVKSIRWFPDSVVEAGEQVTARIFMTAYAANVRVQVVQKGTPLSERPAFRSTGGARGLDHVAIFSPDASRILPGERQVFELNVTARDGEGRPLLDATGDTISTHYFTVYKRP